MYNNKPLCCASQLPLAKIVLLAIYHFAPQAGTLRWEADKVICKFHQ